MRRYIDRYLGFGVTQFRFYSSWYSFKRASNYFLNFPVYSKNNL